MIRFGNIAAAALAVSMTFGGVAAFAQALAPELQRLDAELPGDLINDPSRLDWSGYGSDYQSEGVQDAAIPGGGAARRFTIEKKGAEPYAVATNVPLLADIDRGEVVTVGFYARTLSAETPDGQGVIGVRFQQNAAPYAGFGDTTVSIGPEWKWHEVSAAADRRIRKSEAIVAFQFAGAKQTLEIGQTIVIKGAPSIVSAPTAAVAAAPEPLLPEPLQGVGQLINRPQDRGWGHSGAGGTWAAREEPKIWLGQATRFTTTAVGANPWDLGTAIPIAGAIAAGDKLLIAIAALTESATTPDGKALVGMRIQHREPPYDGFAENRFTVGPNWQLIRVKTTATRSFTAGEAQLALHFANAAQAVDIGPVYVFKTP